MEAPVSWQLAAFSSEIADFSGCLVDILDHHIDAVKGRFDNGLLFLIGLLDITGHTDSSLGFFQQCIHLGTDLVRGLIGIGSQFSFDTT